MKKQKINSSTGAGTVKFMQSVSRDIWDKLSTIANNKGITVQDYLRAIVIPNHLELHDTFALPIVSKKYSKRAKKAWITRRKKEKLSKIPPEQQVPIAPPQP